MTGFEELPVLLELLVSLLELFVLPELVELPVPLLELVELLDLLELLEVFALLDPTLFFPCCFKKLLDDDVDVFCEEVVVVCLVWLVELAVEVVPM